MRFVTKTVSPILTLFLLMTTSFCFAESAVDELSNSQKDKLQSAETRIGGKPVQYPKLTDNSYSVVDKAKILNKKQALKLNNQLFELFQEEKVNLKLATIESLKAQYAEDTSFEKYAKASFSQWNIMASGPETRILVSFDKENLKVEVNGPAEWEKGKAEMIKTLINEYYMPLIKEGKISQGVLKGMKATMTIVRTGALPSSFGFFFKLILFLLIIGGAVYYARENPDNEIVKKALALLAPLKEKGLALKDEALAKLKK